MRDEGVSPLSAEDSRLGTGCSTPHAAGGRTAHVAPPPRRPRPAAPLALLVLVAMVTPTAMNMYLPAMAEMQRDLGTSAAAIQLTLTVFLVATALGQLAVGPISDIVGRRPALVFGLGLFFAGTLACAMAPTVEILIAARVVQAIGGCAGLVLSRAIIRDMHGTATAASMIAYVTMGMAIGPMVTAPIGGVVADVVSWRLIFWLLAALGAAALVLTLLRLDETRPPDRGGRVFARWSHELVTLLGLREFWLFVTTLSAICIPFFSFISGGVFVATDVYGLSPSAYGLFFILNVGGYIIGNFVTGRLSGRTGIVAMIVWGNAVALAGVVFAVVFAMAAFRHPAFLFGPMFVIGFGNGLALPMTVAGAVGVRPQLAGTASGLTGAFQIGSGALASLLVGLVIELPFWAGTLWPVLVPMLIGCILALALSLLLRTRHLT